MKDLFGKALLDYYHNNYTEDIITSTSISGEDVLPLTYLFRNYEEMPSLEQEALKLAKGKVLDVGCGAGNHSLYLQEKGINVKGIDISEVLLKSAVYVDYIKSNLNIFSMYTSPMIPFYF